MNMRTHGAPVVDPATIQGFLDEYGKLETSVLSGECGPVEQVVYWTTQLALVSARDAGELRKMLHQLVGIGQVVYVTYHFPEQYRHNFEYAGRLYALLMDTLPRCPKQG
jgi:hypothetical protein